jgi:hypothetical protein
LFDNGWGAFNLNNAGEIYVNVDTTYFTGPSWILGLYQPTQGSIVAADPAKRTELLAEAFPSLTLPVGANHVDKLAPQNGNDRNFDMQATLENGWPSDRGAVQVGLPAAGEWHHSDFDYVAYPFTYQLFNKIVTLGNLK